MYKKTDEQLKQIFRENGYPINKGEEMEQLELDSLQFISIICDIENEFSVAVPDEFLSGENLDVYQDILTMTINLLQERNIHE